MKSVLLASLAALSLLAVGGSALAETVQYKYDPQGRLIEARYSTGRVVIYKYDAAGNRTEVIVTN